MKTLKPTLALVASLFVVFAAARSASADQDPLAAAKDLYASAAYEDALSALARISANTAAPVATTREADQYRAFCLYALGRTSEAESVAEALIRRDPLVQIDTRDASPRIEAMFTDVRKRLLPGLVRAEYRAGRALFDEKKIDDAQPHLAKAGQMLAEAQKIGAWDDSMADLRVLVDGFLALSHADAAPTTGAAQPAAAASAGTDAGAPPRAAATSGGRAFNAADDNLTPPVVIDQSVPALPPSLLPLLAPSNRGGVIDVTIDETGSVKDVVVKQSINAMYDNLLVSAARRWKYRPALKNGVAVPFVKTIIVAVDARE